MKRMRNDMFMVYNLRALVFTIAIVLMVVFIVFVMPYLKENRSDIYVITIIATAIWIGIVSALISFVAINERKYYGFVPISEHYKSAHIYYKINNEFYLLKRLFLVIPVLVRCDVGFGVTSLQKLAEDKKSYQHKDVEVAKV